MRYSRNKFDLVIYQQNVRDTYLYLIKENLNQIRRLLRQKERLHQPYDPHNNERLYKARAKHLQIMTLLGGTAEHLLKIILLKRGYIINKARGLKYSGPFMQRLEKFNRTQSTQKSLNEIYLEAKRDINTQYEKNTIEFYDCVDLFKKSNKDFHKNFLKYVKRFDIETPGKRYLKEYKQINKSNCLDVIREMRNYYTHLANAQGEVQGTFWYMYNYLLCLGKEEFPEYFKSMKLIGNDDVMRLFR